MRRSWLIAILVGIILLTAYIEMTQCKKVKKKAASKAGTGLEEDETANSTPPEILAALQRQCQLPPGKEPTAQSYFDIGRDLFNKNDIESAKVCLAHSISLQDSGWAWYLFGGCLFRQDRYADALPLLLHAFELDPSITRAVSDIGLIYEKMGDQKHAKEYYRKAIHLDMDVNALNNLANLLNAEGNTHEAISLFEQALQAYPNVPMLYNNLGTIYNNINTPESCRRAIELFDRGLQISPSMDALHNNKGVALENLYRITHDRSFADRAIASYRQALAANPHSIAPQRAIGALYSMLDEHESAASVLRPLVSMGDTRAVCLLARVYLRLCEWQQLSALWPSFETAVRRQAAGTADPAGFSEIEPCVNAWDALTFDFDVPLTVDIAREAARRNSRKADPWRSDAIGRATATFYPLADADGRRPRPSTSRAGRRLRIGYLSADFRNHATGYLIAGVFSEHNRSAFEVFAYSTGVSDMSPTRKKIEGSAEHFVDLAGKEGAEIARRIYNDQIDVIIMLDGYCEGGRMDVLSLQPAPIAINWLGFAGSTGASFIHYVVVDRTVAPPEYADKAFSEKLIYMPTTFFVNDHRQLLRSVADSAVAMATTEPDKVNAARANQGLPPLPAFVFCNFNHLHKITQPLFATWMRILQAVPNSVLWLLHHPPGAAKRITDAAHKHGGDALAERIKFSPIVSIEQHIERLGKVAQLFLDSWVYNGHTTAADALSAGVPVLTFPRDGSKMASRVAASLVAAEAGEDVAATLVVHSEQEYETAAIRLATNHTLWMDIKNKVVERRWRDGGLFDTTMRVRELESAIMQAWDWYEAGLPLANIHVAPLSSDSVQPPATTTLPDNLAEKDIL